MTTPAAVSRSNHGVRFDSVHGIGAKAQIDFGGEAGFVARPLPTRHGETSRAPLFRACLVESSDTSAGQGVS